MANKFGQKETPAPVNREGLRKKCPGTDRDSVQIGLPRQVSMHVKTKKAPPSLAFSM